MAGSILPDSKSSQKRPAQVDWPDEASSAVSGGCAASALANAASTSGTKPELPSSELELAPALASDAASLAANETEASRASWMPPASDLPSSAGACPSRDGPATPPSRTGASAWLVEHAATKPSQAQVEARFQTGLADAVELADAEALRTQAEIDLIVGQFDLARARVGFGRAIAEEP